MRVSRLLRAANPVPDGGADVLSPRAESELADLVGARSDSPAPAAPRRPTRRRLVVAVGCLAVLTAGAGVAVVALQPPDGGPATTREPYFYETATLEGRAEFIVRVQLGRTRNETRAGSPETVAQATVTAVAKGPVKRGDVIEIAYRTPGAVAGAPTGLAPGGEYVLLLDERPGLPPSLVSSIQGYYTVTGSDAIADRSNPVVLSAAVREKLRLT